MINLQYFLLLAFIAYPCEGYNFKCPSDGRHYLLPHETSCAKFYYCEYGTRRNDARCCAPGTLFSFEKQVCDHPNLVRCACGSKANIADCNGTLANGCPSDHTVRRQFPHESDCSKYYNCVKGEKVLESCPKGQHFNAKAEVCDSPVNAGCDPTCSTGCCNNGTLPNGCPANFQIEMLLPHESDCSKYYQCVHGKKVLRSCAPGTHFSDKQKSCEDPSTAGCDSGTGGGQSGCGETGGGESGDGGSCGCENGGGETGGGGTGCGETGGGETGSDGSCGCENGGGEDGGGGNGCGETGGDGSCGCDNGGGEDGGGETGGGDLPNGCPADFCITRLLKHESDCCQFYFCINGEKLLAKCPNGLHFNANLQKCDDPATAGCAPACDEKCKGCHVPFWRDETDCTKFWRCVDGARVMGTCPEGLAFNVEKQTCDFKCNVVCSCARSLNVVEAITANSILNRLMNVKQIEAV
ncbi:chondroitin proteoglycan-2-like [Zerene cesonia]|uniref:chondroitin proteoglycan-2-like n=1 Tax=Zerene cesonia TaxID=33412 RepID=UPI0018E50474|nr:chondroitin proteoglycan-2-like [Zerene cesonia]